MLVLLCVAALAQGLPPNPQALPPAPDPRMMLTAPTAEQRWYYEFLRTPLEDRRAAFARLPKDRRLGIMRQHLHRRGVRLSSTREVDAVMDMTESAVPEALAGDAAARERLLQAEARMESALPQHILTIVRALVPAEGASLHRVREMNPPKPAQGPGVHR